MKSALIVFVLFCTTACVSSAQVTNDAVTMPSDWSVIKSSGSGECASVDGIYKNLGLGKLTKDESLHETRLDAALGHTHPSTEIPARVSITINEETNLLSYQFADPVNRAYFEPVTCRDGWIVIEQERAAQYVGDGTKLDYLSRKISLGKGSDGSLIVHLKLGGQFSSYGVLKSRETSESWSKFIMID